MAKKLLLVRHAKSDWGDSRIRDFDRPLNDRGRNNAPEMAGRLVTGDLIPQLLVSSPALRALSTAGYFADRFGISREDIIRVPEIYEAQDRTLIQVIENLDDDHSFIALFGHNPSITNVAGILTDQPFANIPTCGVVLIRFPFDSWKMISRGTGDVLLYDYPKRER